MLAWGAKVSPEFRLGVAEIAATFAGGTASDLLACMAFETGRTFSPSVRNAATDATGVLQFMPATARGLGTTVDALAAMTAEQQLPYVARYFAPMAHRLANLGDVYMAILYPPGIGQDDAWVAFHPGSREYLLNRGLDIDHDGAVTRGECVAKVRALLEEGLRPGNAAELVDVQAPVEIDDKSTEAPAEPAPQQGVPSMGVLELLAAFGPTLAGMLPQFAALFQPKGDVAKRNVAVAQVALDAVVKAAGASNVQAAVEAMADPAKRADVAAQLGQNASLLALVEAGGGGIAGARTFAAAHESGRFGRVLEVVTYAALGFLLLANVGAGFMAWEFHDASLIADVKQADIGAALVAFGFWLGSSAGSRSKDAAAAAEA